MTPEQREERLAKLKAGREAKRAARKMSNDSLAEPAPAPAPVPAPAKTLEDMTAQELRGVLGGLMGVPADAPQFRNHAKYPNKEALIAEIRRLQEAPVAEAEVVVVETGSVAPSETSSAKQRKNGWADLTPEQKADRLARAAATRQARRAAKMASASSDGDSA
jgi:hypothetical protein